VSVLEMVLTATISRRPGSGYGATFAIGIQLS
jgi:hypothetical protein